jgi:dephospho-CoA kinase
MPYSIAITGGIGVGKSQLSKLLRDSGYCVWDADQFARDVLFFPHVQSAIENLFGKDIFLQPGILNRAKVREIVFSEPSLKSKLEKILHPEIAQLFNKRKEEIGALAENIWTFYEATLIFENNKESQFDACILVTADLEIRQQRLMQNRKMTPTLIQEIINSQMSEDEKKKRTSFVIDNSKDLNHLENQCELIIKKLKNHFKSHSAT